MDPIRNQPTPTKATNQQRPLTQPLPAPGKGSTSESSTGRVHFASLPQAEPRYVIEHNRVQTRSVKEPKAWSSSETFLYGAHSIVWWTRRISGDKSRQADAKAVASFIIKAKLWDGGMPIARVSAAVLKKIDIERNFWWINEKQIDSLANMITAFASRDPRGSSEEFEKLVYPALFGRQTLAL